MLPRPVLPGGEEQSEQLFADIESGSLSDLEDYSEEGEDDGFDEDSDEGDKDSSMEDSEDYEFWAGRAAVAGRLLPVGERPRRKVRAHESATPGNSRAVANRQAPRRKAIGGGQIGPQKKCIAPCAKPRDSDGGEGEKAG